MGFQFDETKGITAAVDAGKTVAAQVPVRELVLEPPPAASSAKSNDPAVYAYRPAGYVQPAPVQPQYREPTAAERRLAELYRREMEAIEAPTATGGGGLSAGRGAAPGVPSAAGDIAQIAALAQAMRPPAAAAASSGAVPRVSLGGGAVSQAEEYEAQNMQEEKEAFLARARGGARENYLNSTRTAPVSKYEIKAGWDIPAVLEQALNSDLPGEVKALVRENVYDTATGRYLLIPQGARLVGVYDSRIAYGQDGIQVVWNRIIFPDGSSINLEGMSGQDAAGATGLRWEVDHHYRRLLGFGLLTSVFSAAFQLSQSRRGGLFGYPSAGEVAGSAVGRELSQLGADVTRRNLNVQPTIKVPVGYRFNVRVNRDVLFKTAEGVLEAASADAERGRANNRR